MGRTVELPSIKLRLTHRHQGLRKLSPDLISKARDETATQVTRIGLTFLGTAVFCLLTLFGIPDSALLRGNAALLGGSEKINVPFAGPVSFWGFMLLGPAVLIVLRVYLQIYVEHGDRLDRLAQSVPLMRAPTLVPLKNRLIRLFSGMVFYTLLPVTMLLFAWKAAVSTVWGSDLLVIAVGVIASHVMLIRFSWLQKALVSACLLAGGVMSVLNLLGLNPLHRPFDLFGADLSRQWLPEVDLRKANLAVANLRGAILSEAKLSGAILSGAILSDANLKKADLSGEANLMNAILTRANLSGANLSGAALFIANLSGADLSSADLSGAHLMGAILTGANLSGVTLSNAILGYGDYRANLSGANLSGAKGITQTQLDAACGDAKTKLPEGLTLKPCSTH